MQVSGVCLHLAELSTPTHHHTEAAHKDGGLTFSWALGFKLLAGLVEEDVITSFISPREACGKQSDTGQSGPHIPAGTRGGLACPAHFSTPS
jgi:hypothetical protein